MSAPKSNSEPNFVMVAPDPATESVERLRRQALRLLAETRGDDAPEPPPSRASADRDSDSPPSSAPSMIAGVLAMPAVFLAIVFAALALFGKPGDETHAAAAAPAPPDTQVAETASASVAPARAEIRSVITLPDEARIESIALDGDRVALHVESPTGREIVIYDYRDGRQLGAAAVATASADATDTLSMLTGPPPTAAPAVIFAEAPPQPAAPAFNIEPRVKPRATP